MIKKQTPSPKKTLNQRRKLSETLEHGLNKDGRKIGHRRVLENGSITYKKRLTSELMTAVQLGISQSVGSQLPSRDILYEDFHVVVTVHFPREGSSLTPAHHCSDFSFRSYAPAVFRYFRNIFKIKPADFLLSLCSDPLKELPNPGASGSIFYVTESEEFIIKTVQHKEAEFLQKLLPGYYMNLNQNPCTLLPKFYGLFCYQSGGKNIRFVVMNNILTSDHPLACKFDLKGSTHKRKASRSEKNKPVPTLKDLDFVATFPSGLLLEADTHDALVKTLDRDCRVLESFKIMDYSILIGIHKVLDEDKNPEEHFFPPNDLDMHNFSTQDDPQRLQRHRIGQFSTPMESIQAPSLTYNSGQIPAMGVGGERLFLNVGIIDILQNYRLSKKLEHTFKSIVHDGDSVSVHHPSFYANRFKNFCTEVVFKSNRPGKRKSVVAMKKNYMDAESMPNMMKGAVYAKRQLNSNGEQSMNHFSDSQPSLLLPRAPHHLFPFNHLSTSSLLSAGTSTATQRTDAATSYTASSPSVSNENLLDEVADDTAPWTPHSTLQLDVTPFNTHPPYPTHSSHAIYSFQHTHQSTPSLFLSHFHYQRTSSNPPSLRVPYHFREAKDALDACSTSPFSTLSSHYSSPRDSNHFTHHPDVPQHQQLDAEPSLHSKNLQAFTHSTNQLNQLPQNHSDTHFTNSTNHMNLQPPNHSSTHFTHSSPTISSKVIIRINSQSHLTRL